MRTDPRYGRVRAMLAEEVPKRDDGGLAFCRLCQRSLYFAGDVVSLLARDLRRAAMLKTIDGARR